MSLLLLDLQSGKTGTLPSQLMPLVYQELRRIAIHHLRNEKRGHTLQPTALVNEAYLKLVGSHVAWQSRAHFFAVASHLMRQILVDYARKRKAAKQRRTGWERVPLNEALVFASGSGFRVSRPQRGPDPP